MWSRIDFSKGFTKEVSFDNGLHGWEEENEHMWLQNISRYRIKLIEIGWQCSLQNSNNANKNVDDENKKVWKVCRRERTGEKNPTKSEDLQIEVKQFGKGKQR